MYAASATPLSEAPLWYLTRTTGIVAFVLLTLALSFGVAASQRALASPSWPRFANQALHRNVSLLALVFLGVHIMTTILDGYVSVSWWSLIIPGASSYRTLWVALGTLAFDIVIAVTITSLIRLRMKARLWRQIHYLVYAMWPLSALHFLNTGTDAAHMRFGVWIDAAAALVVLASVAIRLFTRESRPALVGSVR